MKLTEFQRGTFVGLVVAAVAFAFASAGEMNSKPAQQPAGQSAATNAEQEREGPIERWWAWTIGADSSGFYTFGLIFVGAAQIALFWRQLRFIRKSLVDTERAGKAAEESANTARLALEVTETPYLVPIIRAFDPSVDKEPLSPSVTPIGSYAFENCGRSPATILEIYPGFAVSRSVPDPVPFPPPQSNPFHTSILAPSRESSRAYITAGMFGTGEEIDPNAAEWAVGQVRYADVFGNQFLTGFCYYRNRYYSHWSAVGTPAHNYRRRLSKAELAIAVERDRWPEHHWRN